MAEKKKEPKQQTAFFVRVTLFVFAVFCGVTIFQMVSQIQSRKKEIASVEKQIATFDAQIEELENELATPMDNSYIRKIARNKLNYSMPDDIIYYNDLSD